MPTPSRRIPAPRAAPATATLEDSDGTVCAHCSVGVGTGDIQLSSTSIGAGDTVSISSLTYAAPS
jgi:hypothetical protein